MARFWKRHRCAQCVNVLRKLEPKAKPFVPPELLIKKFDKVRRGGTRGALAEDKGVTPVSNTAICTDADAIWGTGLVKDGSRAAVVCPTPNLLAVLRGAVQVTESPGPSICTTAQRRVLASSRRVVRPRGSPKSGRSPKTTASVVRSILVLLARPSGPI